MIIVNEEKNKMNRKGETTGTNDRNILQKSRPKHIQS